MKLFRVGVVLGALYSSILAKPSRGYIQQRLHYSALSKRKRLLDIVGALVGLVITAILMIPIAIAIQLDAPGPIFYSQIRCGMKGKPFRLWKFRSMVVDAHRLQHLVHNQAKGNMFKNKNGYIYLNCCDFGWWFMGFESIPH